MSPIPGRRWGLGTCGSTRLLSGKAYLTNRTIDGVERDSFAIEFDAYELGRHTDRHGEDTIDRAQRLLDPRGGTTIDLLVIGGRCGNGFHGVR